MQLLNKGYLASLCQVSELDTFIRPKQAGDLTQTLANHHDEFPIAFIASLVASVVTSVRVIGYEALMYYLPSTSSDPTEFIEPLEPTSFPLLGLPWARQSLPKV